MVLDVTGDEADVGGKRICADTAAFGRCTDGSQSAVVLVNFMVWVLGNALDGYGL